MSKRGIMEGWRWEDFEEVDRPRIAGAGEFERLTDLGRK